MTKTERMNYHYMADAMRRLEWDLHQTILSARRVPPEWHEIAAELGRRKKVTVSIQVEEDVLRFFRSMGLGYGPRMNTVLRAFMHARLAGVVKGAETMEYLRAPGERPGWGTAQAEMEALVPGAGRAMSDEPGVPLGDARDSVAERMERLRHEAEAR